eukprot:CAMPEP_0204489840 /NCGR_PEP_ID=MMETSP0471-20130131/73230_1 /ASSEMBLY_ACC=CAM_ASM_000602 /TAXON_ID=2969 /ORGANISM="Oxyrrhis marina" /LENGTH=63 /DNA_ID=CAMNT_0051493719 /DNA_START=454 /DNA_END=641 /DNA_ORIENTATION=+
MPYIANKSATHARGAPATPGGTSETILVLRTVALKGLRIFTLFGPSRAAPLQLSGLDMIPEIL